jgi:hypothetical protein
MNTRSQGGRTPMPELVYLTPRDDVGPTPSHIVNDAGLEVPNPEAGQPGVLTSIGITVPVPTMIGDEVGMTTRRAEIAQLPALGDEGGMLDEEGRFVRARIIPGTRIVETDMPQIVNVLVASEQYVHCDPPKSEQPRKPKQPTTDQGE